MYVSIGKTLDDKGALAIDRSCGERVMLIEMVNLEAGESGMDIF